MPSQVHPAADTPSQPPPSYESHLGSGADLEPFRRHIRNKSCYHADAIEHATVVSVNPRVAFQIEMWTLMEKRWVTWSEKPYHDEPVPGNPIGNLFTNHQFKSPPTIINDKHIDKRDLIDSQVCIQCDTCKGFGKYDCTICRGKTRVNCLDCHHHGYYRNGSICRQCHGVGTVSCRACVGSGKKNCDRCNVSGKLLKLPTLNIEWYTKHSTSYAQNTFLPENKIEIATIKQCFFDADQSWSIDEQFSSLGNLQSTIKSDSPMEFWSDVNKQYTDNHFLQLREDTKIVRLKCTIDRIDITEINYSSPNYNNTINPSKGKLLSLIYDDDDDHT